MKKTILTKNELDSGIIDEGLNKIASVVKRTLGPGGLVIMIERVGQALDGSPIGPKLTKDGVSVAMECSDADKKVDIVIQTVKDICKKTNKDAGDGTTTAIVLGEAILAETRRVLAENKELNPQLVKEELELLTIEIIKELDEMSIPIKDNTKIREVATISANGDEEIGKIIGDAFDHVGAEGVVTVDEGTTNNVTLDVVDGYQFNKGAEGRDSFFNNKSLTQFEAENVAVIIFDGKLHNYTDVAGVLMKLADVDPSTGQPRRTAPPVIFLANQFSVDVLQFLIIQKQQLGLQICCVEGPHMTHVRTGYYDDLAKYTGGERMGNGNKSLANISDDDIGFVSRVVVDKYKSTLYDGQGCEEDVIGRVDQLKAMKELAESPYDAQVLNDRIASLTSGVAKIGVGGSTQLEVKEKYDRIEDALNAARAAIEDGIVRGGGVALLSISNSLKKKEGVAAKILSEALQSPFNQILANIGIDPDEIEEIKTVIIKGDCSQVYNARTKKLVDPFKAGVIDPVKVTKTALKNAVSIAGLLSTCGGAIIYEKD